MTEAIAQPAPQPAARLPVRDLHAGPGLIAGTAILLALIACALVPDWIAPYPPAAFAYRALTRA